MFRILASFLFLISVACISTDAKDLGKYGATFAIKEQDVIEYIKNRLRALEASGELKEAQQQALEKTKAKLKNPNPVVGIITTENEREFYYDPTYVLEEDLKDHEGNIIHKKGYTINPLNTVSFGSDLLFISGEDERQVEWAKKNTSAKVVLVKGSPMELEEKLGKNIYFDQLGSITNKLGIKQVPAIVSQQGLQLKIQELKPENLAQESNNQSMR